MIGRKIEKNNVTIALNVLHAKKEIIYPAYVSKHNWNREKQVILLMIPNGERLWHYLAVKKLSALLREPTSKHYGDFYCLNCLHFFRTKTKPKSHKKVCENKDFCNVIILSEDNKTLEFVQYQKSDKEPFIIYPDVECLIENIDWYKKSWKFIYSNKNKQTYSIKVFKCLQYHHLKK